MAYKEGVIIKGEIINEFYKTPKEPNKLSNQEVTAFLETYGELNDNELLDYGLPLTIASPINPLKEGLEFKCGYTGDLKHITPTDILKTDFGLFENDKEYKINYFLNSGAILENRHIKIDTYFNKILNEGFKRKLISFDLSKDQTLLEELLNLRFNHSINRNSIQKRDYKRRLQEYESNRPKGVSFNKTFAMQNYFRNSKQKHLNT